MRHQEEVTDTLADGETGVLIVEGCYFPKRRDLDAPADQGGGRRAAAGGHRPRAGAGHERRPTEARGVVRAAAQPGRHAGDRGLPL